MGPIGFDWAWKEQVRAGGARSALTNRANQKRERQRVRCRGLKTAAAVEGEGARTPPRREHSSWLRGKIEGLVDNPLSEMQ